MEKDAQTEDKNMRYVWLASLCAWLAIFIIKMIFANPIKLLPVPLSIFWISTGTALSIPCFGMITGIKIFLPDISSPSKKSVLIILSSAVCGLLAYGILFFTKTVIPTFTSPLLFLFAPFLFWVASTMHFTKNRSYLHLAGVVIVGAGIGISSHPIGAVSIANLGSILLAAFAFLAFLANRNGAPYLTIVLTISLLSIVFSSTYLLINWPQITTNFENVYAWTIGGFILGLSLLIFLETFSHVDVKRAVSLMFPCFLISFLSNASTVVEGSLPFLIAGVLVFSACQLIRAIHKQAPTVSCNSNLSS